jgi:dolichyl-phosphate-mannose--protein O-mannosyl transferase
MCVARCSIYTRTLQRAPCRGLYAHSYKAPVSEAENDVSYYEVSMADGDGHAWTVEMDPDADVAVQAGLHSQACWGRCDAMRA